MPSSLKNALALAAALGLCFVSTATWGQGVAFKGATPSVNLGSANVCANGATSPAPCSQTQALSYSIAAGTTIQSIGIVAQGTPNLDFKAKASDSSPTLCAAKTYSSATTCTVDVTFAPLAPGGRAGGVVFKDASGNVLANTYVYGTATGAQLTFKSQDVVPGTVHFGPTVNYTLNQDLDIYAQNLAVDEGGNVYISQGAGVYEIPSGCTFSNCVKKRGGGLKEPGALAVDGSGNVFVIDGNGLAQQKVLMEIPAGCDSSSCVATVTTGLANAPAAVAVGVDGSLYLSSGSSHPAAGGWIARLPPGCRSSACATAPGGAFLAKTDTLGAVAVDGGGNLFISEIFSASHLVLKKIPAGCVSSDCIAVLHSWPIEGNYALTGIEALAVDASENVYFAPSGDITSNHLYELVAASGYTTTYAFGTFDYSAITGLALDSNGNVYDTYADYSVASGLAQAAVDRFAFGEPGSLTFTQTALGMTSSDSPKSIVLQNIGNAPLTGSGDLDDTRDFAEVKGTGGLKNCTLDISLAASAECNLSFAFTPQTAGPITGTLTLSDNEASSPQAITLYGNAPIAQASVSSLDFGSVNFPAASFATATKSFTVTNIGIGFLFVTPVFNGPSYQTLQNTCMGVAAGASCTVTVSFYPADVGLHNDVLTLKTNGKTAPVIQLKGSANGVGLTGSEVAAFTQGGVNFGTIVPGTTEVLSLELTDYGIAGLQGVTFSLSGSGEIPFSVVPGSNCSSVGVAPGRNCTVQILFAPDPGGTAYYTADLFIYPSGAPSYFVPLSGTVSHIAPTFQGPLNFPSIAIGASETLPVVIKNYGAPGTSLLAVTVNGPSYKVLPGSSCMSTGVAPGQSCTLQVQFSPISTGPHNDVLVITPSDGEGEFGLQLFGTGLAH